MKSRESLIRLHRFQVDEKKRQISAIEMMIADMQAIVDDLEKQIIDEQKRSGVYDVTHFAYSTFAKAAKDRQDNIRNSINELEEQLESGKSELHDAYAELKKHELIQERETKNYRSELNAKERVEMDEISANIHRSNGI